MQKKILLNDDKVLTPTQLNVTSPVITAMRCRCAESRRINNDLAHLERRNRQRMIRMKEYQRLRDSVPSIARRPVSKLTIITEAARLIDQLEAEVLNKFQSQGIPKCLKGLETEINAEESQLRIEDVKNLMGQLMLKDKLSKQKTLSLKR